MTQIVGLSLGAKAHGLTLCCALVLIQPLNYWNPGQEAQHLPSLALREAAGKGSSLTGGGMVI